MAETALQPLDRGERLLQRGRSGGLGTRALLPAGCCGVKARRES